IRQAHQLMVEGLEDRRVMSALSMLSQLVDGPAQAANLPPGLVKSESHLLAVHQNQNDNSGSDEHGSQSSRSTFIAPHTSRSEVTAVRPENHGQSKKFESDASTSLSTSSPSSLSTPLAQISVVSVENIIVRDAKVDVRIDKADSQNDQSDNSSSVPVSVRIANGLWDSAPVGPVRIVITVTERVHME